MQVIAFGNVILTFVPYLLFIYDMVFGILGINSRNLYYVKKLNPKKAIRLANNKYKTKQFLAQRWIPVPQTYAHITSRKQLLHFDFATLRGSTFVCKPNNGSKGKGVFIVSRVDSCPVDETKKDWLLTRMLQKLDDLMIGDVPHYDYGYMYRGSCIDDDLFKKKLTAILEGNYTIHNKPDSILIEEKIEPGSGFEQFCQWWLADIRVIVCNLVPVAAMLRMPSESSGGVANLAQWGVGMGIDIPTGTVKTMIKDGIVYEKNFPDGYEHFYRYKIPYWEDILLYSANIQYFVNMWYIGVDWVITGQKPMLLEVNGKAWLEIQNIAQVPLQNTLARIDDLDIRTPDKGVEIARSLFAPIKDASISRSKILYISQRGHIRFVRDGLTQTQDVLILAKTNRRTSCMSPLVASELSWSSQVQIHLGDIIVKDIQLEVNPKIHGHRIELGYDVLKDYYIKPIHKSYADVSFISNKNIIESEIDDLRILDRHISDIAKHINLSKMLAPTNYLDQFDKFVSKQGDYNPYFVYTFPTTRKMMDLFTQIQKLWDLHKWGTLLHSWFAHLLYEKLAELRDKLSMIDAYRKQDFQAILHNNTHYYGSLDTELAQLSAQKVEEYRTLSRDIFGKRLSQQQARDIIVAECKKLWLHPKITLSASMLSRISVNKWHNLTINLSPSNVWREYELYGQIAHEIQTHLMRSMKWWQTKWDILQRWTARYFIDEEGLAIYNAEKKIQEFMPNFENYGKYKRYNMIAQWQNATFAVLFEMHYDPARQATRSFKGLFNSILKVKRWIKDTSIIHPGAIHFKDKIYLDGYRKITRRIDEDHTVDQLMIGKIKIEDLPYIFGA